jgi:hypothetical protein
MELVAHNINPTMRIKKSFIQTAAFGVTEYEMRQEGTYKPRISPENLHKLYLLKIRTKKPITKLVAEALNTYFLETEKRPE